MCQGEQSLIEDHTTASPVSDYYAALGVKKDVSAKEIDASYTSLAEKLHPDRPTGDAAAFAAVNEAGEVLRDLVRRRAYDRWLCLDCETREKSNGVFVGSM